MLDQVKTSPALRIGGLVESGSLAHVGDATVRFEVTDNSRDVAVTYTGLLPDLFREGQGVVAEGVVTGPGQVRADSVLAKHDETYMPREVADALKNSGEWRPDAAASPPKPEPVAAADTTAAR